jgi:hypothetical protein
MGDAPPSNARGALLSVTCIRNKEGVESILRCLFLHYECQYTHVTFTNDRIAHVPFYVSKTNDFVRSADNVANLREMCSHFSGKRFSAMAVRRKIPVIISPLCESENFSKHPLVVGRPGLTSFVSVPLVIGNEFVGSICMYWTTGMCNTSIWAYEAALGYARDIADILEKEK